MSTADNDAEVEALWDKESELYSWIVWSGKDQRTDRIPQIRRCLDHPSVDIRCQAIIALSNRFRLADMEAYCHERIADPHPEIAFTSLLFWTVYHHGTGNMDVVDELRELASQPHRPPAFRGAAVSMISSVLVGNSPGASLYPQSKIRSLKRAGSSEEFERLVDWDEIDAYIEKHGATN